MAQKKRLMVPILQMIALFCIYLIVDMTVAHALVISHSPASDTTVAGTQATINWTTDKAADSTVDYGTSSALGSSESESDLKTSHSITLTGLGAAATYYYKLTSSGNGEVATADNSGSLYSFRTGSSADIAPPQFNVSLPEYYNRRQITFGGYTDPDSVLKLYVNPLPSDIGTDRYTQLTTSDASGHFVFKYVNLGADNHITLWARDPGGNTNTAAYHVMVDTEDPVVKISNLPSLAASTSLSLNGTVSEDVNVTIAVNNDTKAEEVKTGNFNLQISLQEGVRNKVDLQFADKAGNVFEKEFSVDVDTRGPTIVWENLASLDPSYIQEVEIEGNVSKPGARVVIFVNNKTYSSESWSTSIRDMLVHYGAVLAEGDREYAAKADADGHFKIRVFLTQEIASEKSEFRQDVYKTSPTYDQTKPSGAPVTYGTSQAATGRITAGSTGRYSNAWDNKIKMVVFDELGRSDTREGIITFARCGYGADWNIVVTDPTPSVIIPEHLRQGIAQIAFAVKLEWQGRGTKQKLIRDPIVQQYKLSEEMKKNYVFDPNQLVSGTNAVWSRDRKRGYVVIDLLKKDYTQKNFSDMKKEDLFIKLPMQVELEYQYDDGSGNLVTGIQKQCWDITTVLDVRIPPSVIPKDLLNSSIIFLNHTINAIDIVLKPLKAITIVVFVTCLLSWVMYFFALMKKAYDCMDSKEGKESQSCTDAKQNARKVEKYMHYVCDRIFCPSPPLADIYFQESSENPKCKAKGLTPEMEKNDNGCGQEYMEQWDSSCLLMDELKRSKCIRYETTRDARFQQYCAEAGSLKNIWYTVSDFCQKKQTQESRMVSVKKGSGANEQTEQYIIDENGRVYKVKSEVTVSKVGAGGTKSGTYVYTKGGRTTTYQTEPLAQYSEGRTNYDDKITYDEEGRLYYPTIEGGKEKRQYICESAATGNMDKVGYDKNGKLATDKCKDKRVATLPRELVNELNLPQTRKYVVDPTDNLLTALQCVCLPAINGFLTMWRNILTAVMQCFQSILITGDGSSGLCRAVLTTYICDVIFDAIRCFVNRYGLGAGERSGERSSISKFFKSAATAGGDIQKSITGRYGESALYKTMFSERKLIHAVCLWAFTGDFDFDIGSALTGAGAIPLNSEAFLYPTTRRFISSNPLTGYATHIYHIGAGLVAGADMGYKLQLICSNTDSCDVQEGFLNGQCDCYKLGQEWARDITSSFGPGRLNAGEMLGPNEGDIYIKIQDDKYRYDRARLTYWYKDNNGQDVTKTKEEYISQIGGKPPADCKFDLASGEFRCEYEIGDTGYAIFSEKPVPTQELYRIGEKMELKFKIDKKSPPPSKGKGEGTLTAYDQIPFFLRYSVTSPAGSQLEKDKIYPIIADGVQEIGGSIPGITVTEDLLTGRGNLEQYTVLSEAPPGAKGTINPSSIDSTKPQTADSFAVYMTKTKLPAKNEKKERWRYEVSVCAGKFRMDEKQNKEIFYYEDAKKDKTCSAPLGASAESEHSGSAGDLSVEDMPLRSMVRVTYKGTMMDVGYTMIKESDPKEKKMAGFIMKQKGVEPTSSVKCSTDFTSAKPAKFRVKIGLYPCKRKDENLDYSLSNCDADTTPVDYFGQVQEYDIEMNAVCTAKGAEPKGSCSYNARAANECECRLERMGSVNCGMSNDKNYCYYAVSEAQCVKYISCPQSTPGKPVKIENSGHATKIEYGNRYYCDCNGDDRMEDCSNQYCYDGKNGWACYPNPPG